MKKFNLDNFVRGWFVGDFEPSIFRTKEIEVGIKNYNKGDKEPVTVHKETWEITVIIFGSVRMYNHILNKNEIILLEPNDISEFECLEDSCLLVVKYPSNPLDKYEIINQN